MEETPTENATPINAPEPTGESNAALIAELEKKNIELQAQKEHWRGKYERDITSVNTEPVLSEEPDVYSDEGKMLKGEIKTLNEKFRSMEQKESRREVESEFPVLKERKDDFNTFLEDEENHRLSIKKAARLFLAEQNLMTPEPPVRKGLEKPQGGGQAPPDSKMSPADQLHLMQTNYREYEKKLRSGEF